MSIEKLKKMIYESSNIVFFGGAGVSTESDIPDFRSSGGMYNKENKYSYSPEVMLSHTFFVNHTDEFYDFYKSDIIYREARPNKAHLALAELERKGKLKAVITQNIDGLHQMAGSKNVIELHGSIHRNFCTNCHKGFDLDYILNYDDIIPRCSNCGAIIKPDVVLYEEGLDNSLIMKAVDYISNADILIVGGTSLVVYPAAGLIKYYQGDKLVLINKSSTPYDNKSSLVIKDSIGETLQKVI